MKYYKVVRSYKNRLFSYTASNREVQSIINKQKRTKELAAVEYKLGKWTKRPKIGFNHPDVKRMLYVFGNLKAAIALKDSLCEIYECEVKDPEPFYHLLSRIYLCSAVKLIKRIN